MSEVKFSKKLLKKDLLREAKVLNLHIGAVEIMIDKVVMDIEAKLLDKKVITDKELEKIVVGELKKYDKDLAYVYANRDKII